MGVIVVVVEHSTFGTVFEALALSDETSSIRPITSQAVIHGADAGQAGCLTGFALVLDHSETLWTFVYAFVLLEKRQLFFVA